MGVLSKIFGGSPFSSLHEHSKKVHECVNLVQNLTDALLEEDYSKIEELHDLMSKTEHEADQLKNQIREQINMMYFISVGKDQLNRFLAYQDDIADAAEDFAVVLTLRKTKIPKELHDDFREFVGQIIKVSEHLMKIAENLSVLAETAFTGKEVEKVLDTVEVIGQEEWKADRIQRKFARHFYKIEDKMDPVTIMFLDKYCKCLGNIANNAERTAKYLRLIIRKK